MTVSVPWPEELRRLQPYRPRASADPGEACAEVTRGVLEEARARRSGPRWLLGVGRTLTAEVWEALASRRMIPSGWVKDPRRSFADYDGRLQDAPAMLSEVLALARDPPGVEAAEALAWEAMARVAPWGLAAPQTLVWSSTLVPGRATCDAMISLGKCLETTFPQQTPAITRVLETWLPPWEAPFEAARGRVQSLLLWHALYCEAAVRGLALTPREGGMSARCTPGQSPFLAALGVWQRGYGYGGADGAWLNLQVHTEQEV